MKKLKLLILLLCPVILMAQNGFEEKQIQILPDSELIITGDTNIKPFLCDFDTRKLERKQKIRYKKQGEKIIFKNTVLRLDNQYFDCGHRAINRDFHELLQTEKYPEILLELKEIILKSPELAHAVADITIAGKTNTYTLPVVISNSSGESFVGKLKLDINDFNLKPPKKFLGLIVVKEDIEISFNLRIKK
jgi:hypothetical protein